MKPEASVPRSEEPQTASYYRSEESNTPSPFCFLKAILILSLYCLIPKIFLVSSGRQTDNTIFTKQHKRKMRTLTLS
jgi:hypothetical protein